MNLLGNASASFGIEPETLFTPESPLNFTIGRSRLTEGSRARLAAKFSRAFARKERKWVVEGDDDDDDTDIDGNNAATDIAAGTAAAAPHVISTTTSNFLEDVSDDWDFDLVDEEDDGFVGDGRSAAVSDEAELLARVAEGFAKRQRLRDIEARRIESSARTPIKAQLPWEREDRVFDFGRVPPGAFSVLDLPLTFGGHSVAVSAPGAHGHCPFRVVERRDREVYQVLYAPPAQVLPDPFSEESTDSAVVLVDGVRWGEARGTPATRSIAFPRALLLTSFGSVSVGDSCSRRARVANVGAAPVRVAFSVAQPSPPGPSFSLSPSSLVVGPGEDAEVVITWAPRYSGLHKAHVVVAEDDLPEIMFALEGRAEVGVRLVEDAPNEPREAPPRAASGGGRVIDFGPCATGEASDARTIVVHLEEDDSKDEVKMMVMPEGFAVVSQLRGSVVVAFAPLRLGAHEGTLTLATASCGEVLVRLRGEGVAPVWRVLADRVDFGEVASSALPASRAVVVVNDGAVPVRAELRLERAGGAGGSGMELDVEGGSVVPSEDPLTSCVVVKVPARSQVSATLRVVATTATEGKLVVRRVGGDEPAVVLRVSCAVMAPRLQVPKAALAVLECLKDGRASVSLPLRNAGSVAALVSLGATDGAFLVGDPPAAEASLTVPAGGAARVTITFAPRGVVGAVEGAALVITEQQPSGATYRVPLRGIAHESVPLEATPAALVLDGGAGSLALTVRDWSVTRGGVHFAVTSEAFAIKPLAQPRDTVSVEVADHGNHNLSLHAGRVIATAECGLSLSVPVVGISAPANVSLASTGSTAGRVRVASDRRLLFTNSGTGPAWVALAVRGAAATAAGLRPAPDMAVIPGRSSLTVNLVGPALVSGEAELEVAWGSDVMRVTRRRARLARTGVVDRLDRVLEGEAAEPQIKLDQDAEAALLELYDSRCVRWLNVGLDFAAAAPEVSSTFASQSSIAARSDSLATLTGSVVTSASSSLDPMDSRWEVRPLSLALSGRPTALGHFTVSNSSPIDHAFRVDSALVKVAPASFVLLAGESVVVHLAADSLPPNAPPTTEVRVINQLGHHKIVRVQLPTEEIFGEEEEEEQEEAVMMMMMSPERETKVGLGLIDPSTPFTRAMAIAAHRKSTAEGSQWLSMSANAPVYTSTSSSSSSTSSTSSGSLLRSFGGARRGGSSNSSGGSLKLKLAPALEGDLVLHTRSVNFPPTQVHSRATAEIEMENVGAYPLPWSIRELSTSMSSPARDGHDVFEVKFTTGTIPAHTRTHILVSFAPLRPGVYTQDFALSCLSTLRSSTFVLRGIAGAGKLVRPAAVSALPLTTPGDEITRAHARQQGPLSVREPVVTFRRTLMGGERVATMVLVNSTPADQVVRVPLPDPPFSISRRQAGASDPGHVQVTVPASGVLPVAVRFSPKTLGTHTATVIMTTVDQRLSCHCALRGNAAEHPLVVHESQVAFETLAVPYPVRLENIDPEHPAFFRASVSDPAAWAVSRASGFVGPDDTLTLTVTQLKKTRKNGVMTISTRDGGDKAVALVRVK